MSSAHPYRNRSHFIIGLIIACTGLLGGAWLLSLRPGESQSPPVRVKSTTKESSLALATKPHETMAEAGGQPTIAEPSGRPQPVPEPEKVEPEPAPPEVTRAFPSITGAVADWREFRPDNLTVEPWPGARITFTRTAVKEEGRYVTWIGRNPDLPGASLVGVSTTNGYDAILVLPGANQFSYHVRGEKVVVAESTPGAESCGNAPVQPAKTAAESSTFIYDITYSKGHEPVAETTTIHAAIAPLNVDVLVAYDADTLAAATAKSSDPVGYIDGQCKAMLETSNLALSQSLVTAFAWRYLGLLKAPAYTRTGKLNDDFIAMKPGGMIGDWVKSTRYQRGADQITLLIGGTNDWSGVATSPKQTAVTADFSVSVVKWGTSYKILAHELAHNFGCKHDRAHYEVPIDAGPGGPVTAAPDNDGFWCYGQLWDNPPLPPGFTGSTGTSGDIMSYADWPIPYFSNPNISVHVTGFMFGWPNDLDLGTQVIGRTETNPKAAYNARVLNDQAMAMCNISEEITSLGIAQQPANISATKGQSMQLGVKATGGGLAYQWMKGGAAITGATASIYSKTADDSDGGMYTVVVSNLTGTLTSNEVTVTVVLPPPPPPPMNSSSSSSGGGALDLWFCGSLGLLCFVRWRLAGRVRR